MKAVGLIETPAPLPPAKGYFTGAITLSEECCSEKSTAQKCRLVQIGNPGFKNAVLLAFVGSSDSKSLVWRDY